MLYNFYKLCGNWVAFLGLVHDYKRSLNDTFVNKILGPDAISTILQDSEKGSCEQGLFNQDKNQDRKVHLHIEHIVKFSPYDGQGCEKSDILPI